VRRLGLPPALDGDELVAVGAAAAGGLAGCCAEAAQPSAPKNAPASNRLRGDEQIIMAFSRLAEAFFLASASKMPAPVAFLRGSLRYFQAGVQSETWRRSRSDLRNAGGPAVLHPVIPRRAKGANPESRSWLACPTHRDSGFALSRAPE